MPQLAFKDLWDVCKAHRPWMGLVKNRCKNGDHYYVDAYVTPIYEGENITGYQSVRVKPDRKVVDRAEKLYAAINQGKLGLWHKLMLPQLSLRTKAALTALLVSMPALLGGWLAWGATLLAAMVLVQLLVLPVVRLAEESKKTFDNPITRLVYTGRSDEVGQLGLVLAAQRAQTRTILGRVRNSSQVMAEVADITSATVARTTEGVDRQQRELEQVATAMNEMTATVGEVARSAEQTAEASQNVLQQTQSGTDLVHAMVQEINALSAAVDNATDVIERLKKDSEQIGTVVDVISNIASETNLLALNAAIEAARAGEQGRGFAVVADEVRNLASNTQNSTDEIQSMIKSIQNSSVEAVAAMGQGKGAAAQSVEKIQQVGSAFDGITEGVGRISDMNAHIATASEEQSAVSEEMNRNVVGIRDVANDTHDNAAYTAAETERLVGLVEELKLMVRQFGQV
jgi:aerotaxis receptor